LDKIFQFDTQRFRDAVDIVEVPDYLYGIVDGAVIQPMSAQCVEICWIHLVDIVRELGGELA